MYVAMYIPSVNVGGGGRVGIIGGSVCRPHTTIVYLRYSNNICYYYIVTYRINCLYHDLRNLLSVMHV